MDPEQLISAIKQSICAEVEIEQIGLHSYLIHTGFTYHDGDELRIVLKATDGRLVLTDEGHTLMWLSYEDYNMTETRNAIWRKIISSNGISLDEGRMYVECNTKDVGPALNSLIQAMLQTADLLFLDRDRVASTFVEDMMEIFRASSFQDKCEFNKTIEDKKGGTHTVDVYVHGRRPLYVFGIPSQDKAKDALITMMELELGGMTGYRAMVVIDDSAEISKKIKRKVVNRADKALLGLEDTPDDLERYVRKEKIAHA